MVNTTLNTNYYGTINVTQAFEPLINDGGRIIMVSSRAGTLNWVVKDKGIQQQLLKPDLKQDELEKIVTDFKQHVEKDKELSNAPFKQSAYGMSKAALSSYSRILASQLKKRNIFVASYCPGYCQTSMSSGGGNRTATDGAKGIELLCLEKKSLDETGKFWSVEFGDKPKLENIGW